jgi:hypothetical protein
VIRCPNCQADNAPGSSVCYNCRTPLVPSAGGEATAFAPAPGTPPRSGRPATPPPQVNTPGVSLGPGGPPPSDPAFRGYEVPPLPPRPPRQRRPLPIILGIVGAVVAVCCVAVIGFVAMAASGSGPFATTAEETSTPEAVATRTGGRATAVAGSDAAVTPAAAAPSTGPQPTPARPAPTAAAQPTPAGPKVLLVDNFDNPDSGFGTRNNENYQRGYEAGNYVVRFKTRDAFFASGPVKDFSDFQLDVDCLVTTAVPVGACGVVFRWQDNSNSPGDSWHKFQVDPGTGTVRFVTLKDDIQVKNWLEWVPNPAVAKGTLPNHLTVIAKGPQITLRVNNQQVGNFNDPTFSEGTIGLIAHGYTVPSEWHFANLRVTEAP